VTVAPIPPGPIPELPSQPMSQFGFRFEAYNSCRVGTFAWNGFDRVASKGRESAIRKFHENDLKYWSRLFRRTSGLLNLDLHERVALTVLDLCDEFGAQDSRGTLLTVSFTHQDIASLVGASRPRVTEHLGQMERDHLLVRQGRRFIVCVQGLANSIAAHRSRSLEPSCSGLSAAPVYGRSSMLL
jgi:Crp-like helix-turn-helix domain